MADDPKTGSEERLHEAISLPPAIETDAEPVRKKDTAVAVV
jgi:hypothetical protein